jgi:hypothetical protein
MKKSNTKRRYSVRKSKILVAFMALAIGLSIALGSVTALAQEEEVDITKKDETGTDPRGFGLKFMPYYWYGEING